MADAQAVPYIPDGFVVKPKSPFYRVAAKVLIKDDQNHLLVTQNKRGKWELPGGGLEHNESVQECIGRELQEEAGVDVIVGEFRFMFRELSHVWKYMTLRLVYDGKLTDPTRPIMCGEDMAQARFVSRDEFLNLSFVTEDAQIQNFVDDIY